MKTITSIKARENLYKLLHETAKSHEPFQITGKRTNAVLISEVDWKAIQETLYLLSVPAMRESIREGFKADVSDCCKGTGRMVARKLVLTKDQAQQAPESSLTELQEILLQK